MSPCPPQQGWPRAGELSSQRELGSQREMELTWQEILSISELQVSMDPSSDMFKESQNLSISQCGKAHSDAPCKDFTYFTLGLPFSSSLFLYHHLPTPQEDMESDSGLSLNYSDAESLEAEGLEQAEYTSLYPIEYAPAYPMLTPVSEVPICGPHTELSLEKGQGPRGELAGSRDERRALAMKIPFPVEKIINLPVDDFNELVSRFPLSEPQLALIRDIRRRGKNKVAAQNCRKRKLETLVHLERELDDLSRERQRLLRDRGEFNRTLMLTRQKLGALYHQVFCMLHDEAGNTYSPEEYTLQLTADGNIFLVPRNEQLDISTD
uniref:Nuclear factor, erythroid 2 n=1 Tax=Anolis carolinensis TaxID=28377 RepID=G1KW39_ANOCA